MTEPDTNIEPRARPVLDRVLAQESARRNHLVIALSGAHAYGFPSPDSDFDLKAVHIEPTARLLGLGSAPMHSDRMEVIEGIEIDYTSNELKPVLLGILHGNGNYIERILGKTLLQTTAELTALIPLVRRALSRRIAGHYLGFAANQREAFSRDTTAKKLLYVLRTALTGAHALRAAEIITDLGELCEPYGFAAAKDLIATKRRGERVKLEAGEAARWLGEADRAMAALRSAIEESVLPAEPTEDAARALEGWLFEVRRNTW